MRKATDDKKQLEAVFVPRKGKNSIEFAGIFEKDSACDIHGNRHFSGSKRDSISFPINMVKRDSTDNILRKRESVDLDMIGSTDCTNNLALLRRSSGHKTDTQR